MRDELVLADSAGHTMIDVEAVRAADRRASARGQLRATGPAAEEEHPQARDSEPRFSGK